MTQDNNPPGPSFTARFTPCPRQCRCVFGKNLAYSFPKKCRLVFESYVVRSNRALKIGRGGALSCVTDVVCRLSGGVWLCHLLQQEMQSFEASKIMHRRSCIVDLIRFGSYVTHLYAV